MNPWEIQYDEAPTAAAAAQQMPWEVQYDTAPTAQKLMPKTTLGIIREIANDPTSMPNAGVRGFAQGYSGGFGDELTAAITPGNYTANKEANRNRDTIASSKYPNLYTAAQVVGGAISPINKLGLFPSAAAQGYGYSNASDPVDQTKDVGIGLALAGTAALAPQVAGKVAGKVADLAAPNIPNNTAPLVQRARDLGVPLRGDQVAPTRLKNLVQKAGQNLPLSGVNAFEEKADAAFNRSVAATLGQNADNLAPDVINNFREEASNKFNSLVGNKSIVVSPQDVDALTLLKDEARNTISGDLSKIVDSNVDKVIADVMSGNISGEKLANIRSQMLERSTKAEGKAATYIGDIVDVIDDIAKRHLTPGENAILEKTRKEWRNYKTIQPLLQKSTDGNINPTQLLNAVSNNRYIDASKIPTGKDDLIDLARIGKQFFPKKAGSDTFEKLALTGGSIGLLTNPITALKTAVVLGANRGYQGINTSQKLIDVALNRGKSIPKEFYKLPPKEAKAAIAQYLNKEKE